MIQSNQNQGRYSPHMPRRTAGREAIAPCGQESRPVAESIADALVSAGPSQQYCLVVVPTYNEAPNIERLVVEILAQRPQLDVLVVDDNSPDGTGDLVAALAARTPRVQVLRRAGKLGLSSAHYLPALLDAAERGADVVLGSRSVPGGRAENWSWVRKAISRGGNLYARAILGLPVHDCTGGFKCFRAAVLRQIDLDAIRSNGYAFQVEMNYRCHQAAFRIREIPIVFPNRVAGQSKMSWRIVWEATVIVWRLRLSRNPYKQVRLARPDVEI